MKKLFTHSFGLLLLSTSLLSQGATLTVTNTADSGPGTLRQAILDANADVSANDVSIEFSIPGSGVQTIAPLSALPAVTRTVTIDGYTQPGASPNTLANADNAVLLIELSGGSTPSLGLSLKANGCTVRGLVINRFAGAELWVEISDDNVIEGCFIGTDPTGTMPLGAPNGIVISGGAGNRVGGLTPAARNIVGGNEDGIFIQGTTTTTEVLGNYVGVGPDGSTPVPNVHGIYLHYCRQVQVGGSAPGARNLLSGNTGAGCYVNQYGGNFIRGNFIGTDASGTLCRGNALGIILNESTNNVIGGTGAGEGNLISGNNSSGLAIEGDFTSNNVVAGNLIGTDVTGTTALTNGYYGIWCPSARNTIGGSNPSARNVITGTQVGVACFGVACTNNAILGNSIFGTQLGIDLGIIWDFLGPTPNDPGDADAGGNHLQNFPDIASVKIAGRNLKIDYKVDSAAANAAYPLTVEFFIADAGQGRTLIYRTTYTTPQAGDNITFKPAVLPALGDHIVATATDANGNTSEFSTPVVVTRNGQNAN